MLHELFIILSGHKSPLFDSTLPTTFPLVSPSERALLNQLASLGNLHISLRQQCAQIVSTHPSTVARAVASGIDAYHLQKFRDHVVHVEASVLRRDSGVVGGYDIVPLAKIFADFEGWDRILQYLNALASYVLDGLAVKEEDSVKGDGWLKGSDLINRLRADIHTGYPSLQEVSLHLLQVAETAWLRQISTWVVYGRLPTFGAEDFFVKENEGDGERLGDSDVVLKDYYIKRTLLPDFVTPGTASSILFIGRSLAHIRIRGGATQFITDTRRKTAPELGLLPAHLSHLQSLRSPLSPQRFSNAISAIRLSLSKHTLQNLLPASRIVDVLYVLREFFLLGRGEFAVSLISQAEERTRSRYDGSAVAQTGPSLMKEGEVAAVLTRTWSVLSSFQNDNVLDERLDAAKERVYLSLNRRPANSVGQSVKKSVKQAEVFNDLLIGAPVSLNFHITWPMELFLTPEDVEMYDTIFAYLISSRKCLMALQGLWRGRRVPALIPSLPNDRIQTKRMRDQLRKRDQNERGMWATVSIAVFFLETMGAYWQEEIIELSFRKLINLIQGPSKKRKPEENESEDERESGDGDISMKDMSRPTTATQEQMPTTTALASSSSTTNIQIQCEPVQQDPETLTKTHHLYLGFLYRGLFISDAHFPGILREFLRACESLVAQITRVQRSLAFQDVVLEGGGQGVQQQVSSRQVLREMASVEDTCGDVKELVKRLGRRLQRLDEERTRGKAGLGLTGLLMVGEEGLFGEEQGAGKIDRLLMRLNLDHWLDSEEGSEAVGGFVGES